MPEFLVGQPGQAGSGQVLRHILGTAFRGAKQSFSELWRSTWASALSLMLLHWRPSGYSKVCNLPVCHPCQGPAGHGSITRVTFAPPAWPLSVSPSCPYFSPILTSPLFPQTFPSASTTICQHRDLWRGAATNSDKDWGRKAQLEAEGRNWSLFLEADQIEIQMILQRQLEASPPRGKSTQTFQ